MLLFLTKYGAANNVQIDNLELIGNNKLMVSISWENVWNNPFNMTPSNHDAVYCFIKKQSKAGLWTSQKIPLEKNKYQIIDSQNIIVRPHKNLVGILLIPIISAQKLTTKFTIELDESFDTFSSIQVYAVEMVFISSDSFYIGDDKSIGRLGKMNTLKPYQIKSENTIPVRKDSNSLDAHYDAAIDQSSMVAPFADIPKSYPKGFDSFYCMKYEISQEQYVQFLNTLNYSQQLNRTYFPKIYSNHYEINQNGVKYENGIYADLTKNPVFFFNDLNTGNMPHQDDDGQSKACNFLTWADLCAYLDWSGLRPMTELEYEKICRGPNIPKKGEYAWGNDSMTDAKSVLNNGLENELSTNTLNPNSGLANRGSYDPFNDNATMRCGFSSTNMSTRINSGNTFYGVKEMTGNVWEQVVNLSEFGLLFKGTHGDGTIDEFGNADISDWESISGKASGVKGGGWNSGIQIPYNDCAVSDRFYIYQNQNNKRNTVGGRGILSANF